MDKERWRHGLGLAGLALLGALVLAALLYGAWFVVMAVMWDDWMV